MKFKVKISEGWRTPGLEGIRGGIAPLMIEADSAEEAAEIFVTVGKEKAPDVTTWFVLVECPERRISTYKVEASQLLAFLLFS
jgi:hypothetical protein